MSDYVPISCDAYDEYELVCMRGSTVALTLDGETVVGTAVTLLIKDAAEVLVLRLEHGGARHVRLDAIQRCETR